MDDKRIIDLFFSRNEDAINALSRKYGKLCHKISFNILGSNEDAEECVSDAMLGVWNAIPPERPEVLSAFVLKIVKNISLARYKKNTAKKRNTHYDTSFEELEECLSENSLDKHFEQKELTAAIEGFLDTLSRENRVIFMRRYWFSDSYSDIATATGLSEKTVSVRLVRIRKMMRVYLSDMGVNI